MITDGIYPLATAEEYYNGEEWKGRISPSILEHGMQTMLHMNSAYAGSIEFDTSSLSFGRAYHFAVLEPAVFAQRFAVEGQCEGVTGKNGRCSKNGKSRIYGQWFCHLHAVGVSEVESVTEKEMKTILAMRSRLFAHPAVKLLRAQGGTEVAIAWTDKATGIQCKSRLDKWSTETPEILDLKTIVSAEPRAISAAIESYGYARAAEMRKDGIEALTGQRPYYTLIFQEKTEPYDVVAVNLGEATQRGALFEVRALMSAWKLCTEKNDYPGYADDFLELDVPEWKLYQYKEIVL